ncbi:MAG: DUF1800 family protein [Acidobacteriota bacterium]
MFAEKGLLVKRAIQLVFPFFLLTASLAGQVARGGWKLPRAPAPAEPKPLDWGPQAAAHLMRRAGFGASPKTQQRIMEQGLEASLDELLNFESVDDSEMETGLAAKAYGLVRTGGGVDFSRADGLGMQRWWLYRILNSKRQLLEKMTFFWHDHFATSLQKVRFVNGDGLPLLLVQNETLRRHALGNFKEMVHAIARDPAMIIWLDSFANVVGSPNENWGRELMELFTMGEGNGYTEKDIQEAARAFTGWTVDPRNRESETYLKFVFFPPHHDYEAKTVLGQTLVSEPGEAGVQDGDRVIDIIFEQQAPAQFIARKLWEFFVYPNPDSQIVSQLGRVFQDSGYEIKPLMRAIFEHPHFMSEKAYRAKIKSPVEFVTGSFRQMGIQDPGNIPFILEVFGLGQSPFLPPDVGGWTSDTGWINTGTLLGRYNFMSFYTSNRQERVRQQRFLARDQIDVEGILHENQLSSDIAVVDYFVRALVQSDVSADTWATLLDYLNTGDDGLPLPFDAGDPSMVDKKVRGLIYLISLLPVYQLN